MTEEKGRPLRPSDYAVLNALRKGVVVAGLPQVERKLSTEELIRVLTPSDAAVLKALIGGPKSTSELKEVTGLKGQHVNLALQRLRSFGLIVTERKGLVQYHSLTEEGRAIAERAVKAVEARLEAERIVEDVLDRIVEAVRLGVSLGELKRELKRYELELKERKYQEGAKD
jgi:DNA-binding MarR family transcriptional regulator